MMSAQARYRSVHRCVCLALLVVLLGQASPSPADLLIDTVVGDANGDGFDASLGKLAPAGLTHDATGNLYVTDATSHRLRRVDAQTNVITTFAGTGQLGFSGDLGPATQAQLFFPADVVVTGGVAYLADQLNHRVRRIDLASGQIRTVAGTGSPTYDGDDKPGTSASLSFPSGLALLPDGSLLIADAGNRRIRRLHTNGVITTYAGTGGLGYNGDNIPAQSATLANPSDVAVDAQGDVYIGDTGNCRIRVVQAQSQFIFTYGGGSLCGSTGNGGPALEARLNGPAQLELAGGFLYFIESQAPRVRKIDLATTVVSHVAGNGLPGSQGDGGPAIQARLDGPSGLARTSDGRLRISEIDGQRVREVDANGLIRTVVAQSNGDGQHPSLAKIVPKGITRSSQGELLIADSRNNRVRRVAASLAQITTVAGTGQFGFGGEGGPATSALLAAPAGAVTDAAGNIFFSDQLNHRIRRIAAGSGVIQTIAGTGTPSIGGDNGLATAAGLSFPAGLAIGPDGALYVADASNGRIRRIAGGIITTVAGGVNGNNGDGILATQATLANPTDVVLDTDGNIYIAERNTCRVRRVDAETKLIGTVAGTTRCAYSGDGGPAILAELNGPEYLALLENRHLYLSESFTPRVRRVDLFTGIITRVAGNGLPDSTGDGGPGLDAQLEMPAGLVVDKVASVLYISDMAAGRVRRLEIETVPPASFTPTRTRTATPTMTPTVTQTRTFTHTFTPTNTRTVTNTFTPTHTFTPTNTFTATFTSSVTRTPTPTQTASPSTTRTFTVTRTASPSSTPSPTFTSTQTFTRTASPSTTRTATPTQTLTFTASATITSTRTLTATPTTSFTRTATATSPPTATPTITSTRTASASPSPSRTASGTPTHTLTATASASRTASPSRTATVTAAPTDLPSATRTPSGTPTRTNTPLPTLTRTSTATAGPTSSFTPVPPTASFTATPSPGQTATRTATQPTSTPTRSFTRTTTRTVTRTATAAAPPSLTPMPSFTFTRTPTATVPTATATLAFTRTHTRTQTPAGSVSASPTRTGPILTSTPNSGVTPLPGTTPTFTLKPTQTSTITRTATLVPTSTPTVTRAATRTFTPTPTITLTPTITPTVTPRLSATRSATLTRTITRTFTPPISSTPTPALPSPTRTQTVALGSPSATRTRTPTPSITPSPTRSATTTRTRTRTPTAVVGTSTPVPSSTATRAPDPFCTGDCNLDNFVSEAELNFVLTRVTACDGRPTGPCENAGACARADTNADGEISASELTRTLENVQRGCGP